MPAFPKSPLWFETVKVAFEAQQGMGQKPWQEIETELFGRIWKQLRDAGYTCTAIQEEFKKTYGLSSTAYYTRYKRASAMYFLV